MIGTAVDLSSIVFDQLAMNRLLRSEDGPTGQHILSLCRDVEAEAKWLTDDQMVNVDTGLLNSSITHVLASEGGEIIGLVGTNVEYALFVHEADRPYLETALETVMREQR